MGAGKQRRGGNTVSERGCEKGGGGQALERNGGGAGDHGVKKKAVKKRLEGEGGVEIRWAPVTRGA
jgi:hypothetical protein